jgi:hypothetical protein
MPDGRLARRVTPVSFVLPASICGGGWMSPQLIRMMVSTDSTRKAWVVRENSVTTITGGFSGCG